jgi:hypothetical protein
VALTQDADLIAVLACIDANSDGVICGLYCHRFETNIGVRIRANPGSICYRPQMNSTSSQCELLTKHRADLLEHERWLSAAEAARLLDANLDAQASRQTAQRLLDSKQLLAVWTGQDYLYPEFQFHRAKRTVLSQIADLLKILPKDETGWRQTFWLCQRHATLNGSRPIDAFEEAPDAVIRAAKSDFEISDERW